MLLLLISILMLCGVNLPNWVWIVCCVLGSITTASTVIKATKYDKEK